MTTTNFSARSDLKLVPAQTVNWNGTTQTQFQIVQPSRTDGGSQLIPLTLSINPAGSQQLQFQPINVVQAQALRPHDVGRRAPVGVATANITSHSLHPNMGTNVSQTVSYRAVPTSSIPSANFSSTRTNPSPTFQPPSPVSVGNSNGFGTTVSFAPRATSSGAASLPALSHNHSSSASSTSSASASSSSCPSGKRRSEYQTSRKKTNVACTNCVKAKAGCDQQRPCGRCRKLNKTDCKDRPVNQTRKRKKPPTCDKQPMKKQRISPSTTPDSTPPQMPTTCVTTLPPLNIPPFGPNVTPPTTTLSPKPEPRNTSPSPLHPPLFTFSQTQREQSSATTNQVVFSTPTTNLSSGLSGFAFGNGNRSHQSVSHPSISSRPTTVFAGNINVTSDNVVFSGNQPIQLPVSLPRTGTGSNIVVTVDDKSLVPLNSTVRTQAVCPQQEVTKLCTRVRSQYNPVQFGGDTMVQSTKKSQWEERDLFACLGHDDFFEIILLRRMELEKDPSMQHYFLEVSLRQHARLVSRFLAKTISDRHRSGRSIDGMRKYKDSVDLNLRHTQPTIYNLLDQPEVSRQPTVHARLNGTTIDQPRLFLSNSNGITTSTPTTTLSMQRNGVPASIVAPTTTMIPSIFPNGRPIIKTDANAPKITQIPTIPIGSNLVQGHIMTISSAAQPQQTLEPLKYEMFTSRNLGGHGQTRQRPPLSPGERDGTSDKDGDVRMSERGSRIEIHNNVSSAIFSQLSGKNQESSTTFGPFPQHPVAHSSDPTNSRSSSPKALFVLAEAATFKASNDHHVSD